MEPYEKLFSPRRVLRQSTRLREKHRDDKVEEGTSKKIKEERTTEGEGEEDENGEEDFYHAWPFSHLLLLSLSPLPLFPSPSLSLSLPLSQSGGDSEQEEKEEGEDSEGSEEEEEEEGEEDEDEGENSEEEEQLEDEARDDLQPSEEKARHLPVSASHSGMSHTIHTSMINNNIHCILQ